MFKLRNMGHTLKSTSNCRKDTCKNLRDLVDLAELAICCYLYESLCNLEIQ